MHKYSRYEAKYGAMASDSILYSQHSLLHLTSILMGLRVLQAC